jgi:hypothetical protein
VIVNDIPGVRVLGSGFRAVEKPHTKASGTHTKASVGGLRDIEKHLDIWGLEEWVGIGFDWVCFGFVVVFWG